MIVVYALVSSREKYIYVGMTENLTRRLGEHNSGAVKSTKARRPYRVLYQELQPDRTAAREREKYLKSGAGKEFLKTKI